MLNVLGVDVEDYFHVEAFAGTIRYEQWDSYERRVERNVERILELFAKYKVKGTFFILGWVAEKLPHLSRRIAIDGHEIGCHGFAHQRIQTFTPGQFREDLKIYIDLLTDQVQLSVQCYRSPSISVIMNSMSALKVLEVDVDAIDS